MYAQQSEKEKNRGENAFISSQNNILSKKEIPL